MSERHLDNEIDRAVRDIMAVDTDAAFRSRVLERLDRSKPRHDRMRFVVVAAAAAVVVLIAVMMTPEPGPVPQRAERTTPAVTPRLAHVVPGLATPNAKTIAAGPADIAGGAPQARSRRRAAAVPQIAEGMISATVAMQEPTVEIQPLRVIEPIAVAPLETPRIVAQEIVLAPLEPIAEVQIGPLSPRSERD